MPKLFVNGVQIPIYEGFSLEKMRHSNDQTIQNVLNKLADEDIILMWSDYRELKKVKIDRSIPLSEQVKLIEDEE